MLVLSAANGRTVTLLVLQHTIELDLAAAGIHACKSGNSHASLGEITGDNDRQKFVCILCTQLSAHHQK